MKWHFISQCDLTKYNLSVSPFVLLLRRVLLVDRQESRLTEWMARKFFSAVSAVGYRSMSVPIQEVAKAMVSNTVLQPEQKMEILENKDIATLGKSTGK